MSPSTLIFLHIPKTAGTTLARIIDRNYGAQSVLRLYDSSSGEELAAIRDGRLEQMRVIMGHLSFGVHQFLPLTSAYITMLRKPMDRVVSHYHFVQGQPDHYLYEASRRLSLAEFVAVCGADEPNNDQTRLLAGDCGRPGSGARPREMLAAAKEHLRDRFAVVGLTEDFDRSVLLMKHAFGWHTPFYVKENVARRRPAHAPIALETQRAIRVLNQLDLELYDYAQELLEIQVARAGAHLETELRRFRCLNYAYGRLHEIASSRWLQRRKPSSA